MSEGDILFDIAGTTGWITLNRPERRNALTFAMYDRLADICRETAREGKLRCLVICGAGEKAFAAGTEMSEFRAFVSDQDALDYEDKMDRVMGALESCPVPIIAAISGACTGGGAAIAAACDLRIASADLRFGFPIARTLGNALSIANLSRLSALVGAGCAKEMLLTARLIGAEEAHAVGLVSEICPDRDALLARAGELAGLMAEHAPRTLAATKEGLRRLRVGGASADDRDLIVNTYCSEDFREGMDAFLSKRKPRWTGR